MELRHLRYFVAVAEELHFRRAAERLHMSQPPLSQQIRALEEEVGAPLLLRNQRKVELTAAGAAFYARAREILAAVEDAALEARRVQRGEVGRLAVGFVGSAMYSFVPELLRAFREMGNAVLLGTGSFWEGIDVKGEALSVVIIDKLPFAAPDDPLLKARLAAIREQGGNPFFDEQVPQAVIALKQGVGRLIRDDTDFGVVMLCDTRLVTKGYGRSFIASLPPMQRTRSLEDVQAFLRERLA